LVKAVTFDYRTIPKNNRGASVLEFVGDEFFQDVVSNREGGREGNFLGFLSDKYLRISKKKKAW